MGDGNLLLTNRRTQKKTDLRRELEWRHLLISGQPRLKLVEMRKFERDSTLGVSYDAHLALLVLPYHRFQYFRNRARSHAEDPGR